MSVRRPRYLRSMTMTLTLPSHLTDEELVAATPRLAGDERLATAVLIAHLAELERRKLYIPAGYASLYTYCRERLGLSEDAAYNRTAVADVARRHPAVLDMLADGRLSPTAVRLLASVLREDNWREVCAEAAGMSRREVEVLIARLAPKPDVPSAIRKLPAPPAAVPERQTEDGVAKGAVPERKNEDGGTESPVSERQDGERHSGESKGASSGDVGKPSLGAGKGPVPLAKRPVVAPLSADRYRVQFTIGEETEKKLRRLQQLLKREIPSGDPAVIFDKALDLLLAKVQNRKEGTLSDAKRAAAPPRPLAPGSRRVPAATRRVVARRDSRQCAFVGTDGRRCTERAYLEYHHAGKPFAHGGGPGAENIALHCRAHNAYEAERIFGRYLPPEVREARIRYDAMRFPVPERGL